MDNKITICTVCADDFEIINKNISYTENNNNINIDWLITINQYSSYKENNLKLKSNLKYLKGFLSGEIESPSLDHGIGLNKTIDLIKTRYVIFLDPDFFILKKNLINEVLKYMKTKDLSFFGVPWHPKWYSKYRYFPCCHCLFVDLKKIKQKNLDFRPTIVRWNRNLKFEGTTNSNNFIKKKFKLILGKKLLNFFTYLTYNRKTNNGDFGQLSKKS